jgi:hypothetical protein
MWKNRLSGELNLDRLACRQVAESTIRPGGLLSTVGECIYHQLTAAKYTANFRIGDQPDYIRRYWNRLGGGRDCEIVHGR